MKQKGTKDIIYTQRLQLEAYLRAGLHKSVIAEKLGLCLATVYVELKRGAYSRLDGATWTYRPSYSPNIAEDKYRLNQTAKGAPLKIGGDYDFVHYVERRVLRDKLSPCAVLGEIRRNKLFSTDIARPRFTAT